MMDREIILAALKDVDELKRKLEAVLRHAAEPEGNDEVLKREDGRLTEAGIKRMQQLFAAGHGNTEIARILDISQPSVSRQRTKYEADL